MISNIVTFDSASSPYREFTIEQEPSTDEELHDHQTREVTGDGSLSTVCHNGQMRGPFRFLGDAMAEMKRWAAEAEPAETIEPEQPAE